ncbi:uncharacterized protein GGS22DRAFT_142595 [Annulohypoxylon maeteangense]|uniref:uncharacterized protein n=1 Tax=Annulohypoxylon maeteangense TaxID=1927788 RepID=UPI0020080B02|nr:uncharacterized protein GGS22DRAFT_142595 [Annulohypoxylon maeteangense]KAI0885347.1 hypothetical protein GGS22DRAFT_142595 [Annulohypoxylon maeteangense]
MTSHLLSKRSVIPRSFRQSIILPVLTTPASYRTKVPDRRDQLHDIAYFNSPRLRSRYIRYILDCTQNFTTTRTVNMASDADYMAFLDKANEDPSKGYPKAQSSSKQDFKATDDGAQIPAAIQEATKDSFYVSDADEPFVPVYLAWNEGGKGLPDEEEFATLIHHPEPANAQIEILDPADWDTQGQYKAILDAVQKAGKGNDIRVYRVSKGGVKVEYWVVTTEGKGASAKLVGAKALAVES